MEPNRRLMSLDARRVGVAELGNEHWGAMVYALGQVAIEWLVLLWMYRKGAFLKV